VYGMGRTHLVGGHHERVNVALFRGVAVLEAELLWVEQFWGHVANNALVGGFRSTRLHDCGIGYDTGNPEVPQACGAIIGDQDISLDRTNISARLKLGTLGTHRIDIAVDDT
jgi:hypothetical protein